MGVGYRGTAIVYALFHNSSIPGLLTTRIHLVTRTRDVIVHSVWLGY